jgi:predicted alpha/beta hydrolase family esterase
MAKGLIKISGNDKADVVFVHGLGGDALTTWEPRGNNKAQNSWLYWLAQDLPSIQVWSLGYEAEAFPWKGSTMPLYDRATNLLETLNVDGLGSRPLYFVTHSLGGLVVKQMLRNAKDSGNSQYQTIAEKTQGIVFISTPHSGSDLAHWIQYLGGILTTVSVDELKSHDPQLRQLNDWYRNDEQFSTLPIKVYCEKKPTKSILVVNETSANPGIKGIIPIPMDNGHISICKPSSRDALIYKGVKKFIEDQLLKK